MGFRNSVRGIRPGTVGADELEDNAVTRPKLADLAVGTAEIDQLAVTAAKIADLAVTDAKIADLAVTNAKIADLAVTNAKIADLAVTNAKIAGELVGKILTGGTLRTATSTAKRLELGVDPLTLYGPDSLRFYADGSASHPIARIEHDNFGSLYLYADTSVDLTTNLVTAGTGTAFRLQGPDTWVSALRYSAMRHKDTDGTLRGNTVRGFVMRRETALTTDAASQFGVPHDLGAAPAFVAWFPVTPQGFYRSVAAKTTSTAAWFEYRTMTGTLPGAGQAIDGYALLIRG